MQSPIIWAIWIAAFADMLLNQLIGQFMPIYMTSVLDLHTAQTGIYAALPIIGLFGFKVIAGLSSDHMQFVLY